MTCKLLLTTTHDKPLTRATIGPMPSRAAARHDRQLPLEAALDRVGDRWSLLVVEALLDGPRRFGELGEALPGIAPNILTDRLRRLERAGIVRSSPYQERPTRLAYDLTADGRDLASALRLLADWGTRRSSRRRAVAPRRRAARRSRPATSARPARRSSTPPKPRTIACSDGRRGPRFPAPGTDFVVGASQLDVNWRVPVSGEAVAVIIIGLAVLLSLRLLMAVPGWAGRNRKPESRAIRVVGVGGGGSNAVDRMVMANIHAASFVVCNTDAQALRVSTAATKIRIGDAITGGLGSGGDPEIGRRAAEEDEAKIARAVAGADLVFVTAGLGGGTGSGAAPIVAATARAHGALTIAVVTKPFGFEGSHRRRIAEAAAAELEANVDALIVVPNDRVADVAR